MTFQKVEKKVLRFRFTIYDAVDWEINQKIFFDSITSILLVKVLEATTR